MRDRIRALADEANDEANAELKANPNDVNALFARGWTKAFVAIYDALVERSFAAGLRSAMSARGDCDKVLQIDPHYVDAELVVGVYQYVVGSLPFAFKLLVGIVGIRGSKGVGHGAAARRGRPRSGDARGSEDLDDAVSAAGGEVSAGDRDCASSWRRSIRTIICSAWKRRISRKTGATGWSRCKRTSG